MWRVRDENQLTEMDDEVRRIIDEGLRRKHGNIVRLQGHDAPEWFGKGWLVSFELPKRAIDRTPLVFAAFFREENGRPVLAKEMVIREVKGDYPQWKPLTPG